MKKNAKKWIRFNFGVEEEITNGVEHMETEEAVADHSKHFQREVPLTKKRSFNFQLHLKPKTVTDLAVHSKKIAEVETWFQNNVTNKTAKDTTANFLLVTGPTGSGKTATVRVLCENLNIGLTEWVNPVDQDFEICYGPNQITRFTEFLTESKWNSLFSTCSKKVILVEEFPNALIRSPKEFDNVLEVCYYKGNYSIIFITTDAVDNRTNLSETLFPQEIRDKYKIAHISFNSCAPTMMKNALRRAHNLVQENLDLFKTPSHNTVNAILATAMGDIRCAINQYYFASLLGTSELPVEKSSAKTGVKRKRNENNSCVASMCRDEALGLFHGLGKVLNPKRNESGKLNCNFDKLIDEFSTQPGIFTAFLFENYIKYFGDLNDTCCASDILSLSQTFLEKWVDRHDTLIFALWVSVFGLMLCNEHRVSRWNQIKGPKKTPRRINHDPETRHLSVTDLFYYNVITKKNNPRFSVMNC